MDVGEENKYLKFQQNIFFCKKKPNIKHRCMNLESTGKEPPDMDPDKLKIQTDSYELESDSN